MNPQQPRVCARHTYPRMQGKPHVDSHLHVMHSPPRVHTHSSAYACVPAVRRSERSYLTCCLYLHCSPLPARWHHSEPAAPGLHRGSAVVRRSLFGQGLWVGHEVGFPCRFAAVRCSRDAGGGQRFLASLPAPLLRAFLPGSGRLSWARHGPAGSTSSREGCGRRAGAGRCYWDSCCRVIGLNCSQGDQGEAFGEVCARSGAEGGRRSPRRAGSLL